MVTPPPRRHRLSFSSWPAGPPWPSFSVLLVSAFLLPSPYQWQTYVRRTLHCLVLCLLHLGSTVGAEERRHDVALVVDRHVLHGGILKRHLRTRRCSRWPQPKQAQLAGEKRVRRGRCAVRNQALDLMSLCHLAKGGAFFRSRIQVRRQRSRSRRRRRRGVGPYLGRRSRNRRRKSSRRRGHIAYNARR